MPHATRTRRPLPALAAAGAALALVLSGCTGGGPLSAGSDRGGASDGGGAGSGASTQDTPPLAELGTSAAQDLPRDPAEDPAYEAYYEQRVSWSDCRDEEAGVDRECGRVKVPKVWNDPSQGDISIAVARSKASGERKGSLLINPGGPGGSGVDFISSATYIIPKGVQEAYDLVSFDPRGVSRSEGVECLPDEEVDAQLSKPADPDLDAAGQLEQSLEWMRRMGEGCQKRDGGLLPYLDTYSAARDLDVLRSAVDSEKLDYLGYSYGTYLGATYAQLYPGRVGRFVLDGAMDPTLNLDQIVAGQATGFEKAFGAFLQQCLDQGDDGCVFKGGLEDAKKQLGNLLDGFDRSPVKTDDPEGRRLTGSLAGTAVMLMMYDDSLWATGREALQSAADGDGTMLLRLADMANERNSDGTFNGNGVFAINAINCLDHPGVADRTWQKREAERLEKENPLVGEGMGYGGELCAQWPVKPVREPAPVSAKGAGPILVIGTTGDPATPYPWAQSLAKQLDSGVLLTFQGNGHTAYGRSGGCIEKAVDAYLLEDKVPEDGLTCS